MSQYQIEVPDHGTFTDVSTQHGMQYPDGSIVWGKDDTDYRVPFRELADGNATTEDNWKATLKRRAERANMDYDTYAGAHVLMKRTFVVTVTEAEEL